MGALCSWDICSETSIFSGFGGVHGPHEELTAGYPKNDDLESMYLQLLEYGLFFVSMLIFGTTHHCDAL